MKLEHKGALYLKWSIVCFFVFFSNPVFASSPLGIESIPKVWTGLDRAFPSNRLNKVTLRFAIDDKKSVLNGGNTFPITGTLTSIPAKGNITATLSSVEEINGSYNVRTGILRFQRGSQLESIAVFNSSANQMAAFYTGHLRAPFFAISGEKLSPADRIFISSPQKNKPLKEKDLQYTERERKRTLEQKNQANTYSQSQNRNSRKQERNAIKLQLKQGIARIRKEGKKKENTLVKTLKEELLLAKQDREHKRAINSQIRRVRMEIRKETAKKIREFTVEVSQKPTLINQTNREVDSSKDSNKDYPLQDKRISRSRSSSASAPLLSTKITKDCPGYIVKWASQMGEYRVKTEAVNEFQLKSNLFRERFFVPFFGKAFSEMNISEKRSFRSILSKACGQEVLILGHKNISVSNLSQSFHSNLEIGASRALALDLVFDWYQRMIRALEEDSDITRIEQFQQQTKPLYTMLWPDEINKGEQKLAQLKSQRAMAFLIQGMANLVPQAGSNGGQALAQLAVFPQKSISSHLLDKDRMTVMAMYEKNVTRVLDQFLTQERKHLFQKPQNLQSLIDGKKWFVAHKDGLENLLDFPAVNSFFNEFGAYRNTCYLAEKKHLIKSLDAEQETSAIESFSFSFQLALDSEKSDVFKEIESHRIARLATVKRLEYIALVGEGPLKPDDLGAIYINAIYRNDIKKLKKIDNEFFAPHIALAKNLSSAYKVMALMSPGDSSEGLKQEVIDALNRLSLVMPITATYLLDYEDTYPACMDAQPVIRSQRIAWTTVISNGYGEIGRYPSGGKTYNYRVNHRHVDAFDKINPKEIAKNFVFKEEQNIKLREVLQGLKLVMRNYSCDSEMLKQFERNLLNKHMLIHENE